MQLPTQPSEFFGGFKSTTTYEPQISLRDWFAGMAMQGNIAYSGMEGSDVKFEVAMAYEFADAMLAEREKAKK